MYKKIIKTTPILVLIYCLPVIAEVDIKRNIYDGAEDIIRMDEKMNRAIAKHNQITPEENTQMHMNIANIEDFKEIKDGYILEKEIQDSNRTKVDVKIENGMLVILTTLKEEEKVSNEFNMSFTTTTSSSEISLFIPRDADINSMEKKYENGILKIKFFKK